MSNKKHYSLILLAICLSCFVTLRAFDLPVDYPNFKDNPYLDDQKRQRMAPHLIPLDHPLKATLDSIFSKSRVIHDKQSLLDAGFQIIAGPMVFSYVIVVRHPLVPGYVFKLYLDTDPRSRKGIPHWLSLIRRCEGAAGIRKIIADKQIRNFVVPDKWLYVLPYYPFSTVQHPEAAVLMETDMEPENEVVSRKKWKTVPTRKTLDELYSILKHGYGGMGATRLSLNVPYTKQGKFAFIDTESPRVKPKLHKLKGYFSKDLQHHWENLTK